jgi:ABC-2 type transport system permease protein
MLGTIKSEFRKIFTVRSTYFILLITLVLEFLVFFLASAYNLGHHGGLKLALSDPNRLSTRALVAVNALGLIYAGVISVLNITHEYRYNTITYTLSASKSRSIVFFSKLIVLSVFSIVFGAIFALLAPLLAKWGFAAHHYTLVHQTYNVSSIAWRAIFGSWAISMFAAIIALIVRNQVGAIATMFIVPSTVEGLLGLWLHNNSVYLPFDSVLNVVLGTTPTFNLSYAHAALVALAWIVGGSIIAWVLFLKRDAN